MLRGVDEGVIGVSADRRITVFNREAKRLLGFAIDADLVGPPLTELQLPGQEESALPDALGRLLTMPPTRSPRRWNWWSVPAC